MMSHHVSFCKIKLELNLYSYFYCKRLFYNRYKSENHRLQSIVKSILNKLTRENPIRMYHFLNEVTNKHQFIP